MRSSYVMVFSFAAFLPLLPALALANAAPGEPAPAFRATDAGGQSHTLSEYIGNWLVLEWFNPECEYVQAQYESGKMQALQKRYTDKGVHWLTVISSARDQAGYLEPNEALDLAEQYNLSASEPFLLDSAGVMGRAFDVKTTPQVFVINPKGVIVYAGALYDEETEDADQTDEADNYLVEALEAGMQGEEVETSATNPHGCPVQY